MSQTLVRAGCLFALSAFAVVGCSDEDSDRTETFVQPDAGDKDTGVNDAGGLCDGVDCTNLDGPCSVGVCNAATGACETENRPDNTACDDANGCTLAETCFAGVCTSSTAVDCSALDGTCVVGVCDPDDGRCMAQAAANGTACQDENLCTVAETCQAGTCTSTTTLDCSGLDGTCVTGVCDPADGSCNAELAPDGSVCEDGNLCTLADSCQGGTCSSTTTVDCSSLDGACSTGVCDPVDGSCLAQNVPDGTVCDDNSVCTAGDRCLTGTCTGAAPLDCSSLAGPCTVGSCDSITGCFAAPLVAGTGCDDLNQCTSMDVCDGVGLCVGQTGACGPRIIVSEDFDSTDGNFVSGGTSSSWAWGQPSGSFISLEGTGDAEWVTNLSGNYVNNEDSWIESPQYDFRSALSDPILELSLIYETETSFDGGWVETSTDGSTTWNVVGEANTGLTWYNNASDVWWDGESGEAGQRFFASNFLPGTAGQSDVRVRFRMQSDGSSTDEGISVDDLVIREATTDVALDQVILPPPNCTSMQGPVSFAVRNEGGLPISGFSVSLAGLTTMPITETSTLTIQPFQTLQYTMQSTINVTSATSVTFSVSTPGDVNTANDTLSGTLGPVPTVTLVSGTAYTEDFETGAGGWTPGGTNSSWQLGTPSNLFISAAGQGSQAFVTNLAGNYNNDELSYVESPCFDFSSLTEDPLLSFSQLIATEDGFDGLYVETSTTGGATWNRLGTSGTRINWYNNETDQWWDDVSDSSASWREAANLLAGTAGLSEVLIRFVFSSDSSVTDEGAGIDSIEIGSRTDLAIGVIFTPPSACAATEPLTVEILNNGTSDASGFSITGLNFGTPGSVTETVIANVPALSSIEHTFSTALNLTSTTTITVAVSLSGDSDISNDARSAVVIPGTSIVLGSGYSEGFESGAGGWTVEGANASWQVGTPAGTFISAAATGTEAAVTNLSGNYNNFEGSFLISPCFDMSAATSDPTLSFSHIFETESGFDATWVEISTNGGITWTTLGASAGATNWYNDALNELWDGISGLSGAWRTASSVLSGASGSSQVLIRFVMDSDISATFEGVGVDDVDIR